MMTQEQLPLTIDGIGQYQHIRQRPFGQFAASVLPTVKDEEWKYTSLAEIANRRFCLAHRHRLIEDAQLARYLDKADINIVLVNGVLWADLSDLKDLPRGLSVSSLDQAIAHDPQQVLETSATLTANDTKAFVWMNQALFLDGAFVSVDKGAVIEPLVHIIHVTSGIEDDTLVFPRSFINIGEAAQVKILESHVCFEPQAYLSNALTDMKIGANAVVQYCKAQAESHQAVHVGTTRIWQEKGSDLDSFSFAHGARLTRNNLSILLNGEGANTVMNGLYALDGAQHVDNHTLLDIRHPNCASYQLYKGILNDASRAVFNGKIYVHAEAQKTNAYQLNKHLLLGRDARVDTKPQLEIFADDVKCTHGATIGQLSPEEIFYLQSRCISKPMAVRMMSKGFIDDIINTVKSLSMRAKLNRLLSKKFPEIKI